MDMRKRRGIFLIVTKQLSRELISFLKFQFYALLEELFRE